MKEFDELVEIFRKLRSPEGCPWDKAQNHQSILQCAVDEVYEFLEATEEKNESHMCEELGDLLLQVVFHSQMASERGAFAIQDVIQGINQKLYKRHPHVFGDGRADSPDQVIQNWEAIKAEEKPQRKSVVDGVPKSLPALFMAEKVQRKAAGVGFDWPDAGPVWDKVHEELEEFQSAVREGNKDLAHEEMGDILFSLVNLARHSGISAEEALRMTIQKFIRRFQYVEGRMSMAGKKWDKTSLAEMDVFWEEAKGQESR